MASGLTIVFGAASTGNYPPWNNDENLEKAWAILKSYGVEIIDSAQLYGKSEEKLGQLKAGERFTIDTKWLGGWNPQFPMTKENVLESAKASIQKLGVKQVDIFYLHSPDRATPIKETLEGINEAHKLGLFRRLGLSNFTPEEVQEAYDVAKANGWVLPTVYQGNYSPAARRPETLLFPTLRKLGMAFYAYSPLAGGFLTKTKQQIVEGVGRFANASPAPMYAKMYARPALLEGLEKWAAIADAEGVTKAELAYRWVSYNSPLSREYGDAIIVGASSLGQVEGTLAGLKKGPLSDASVKAIDEFWEGIKHEAPLDNFAPEE